MFRDRLQDCFHVDGLILIKNYSAPAGCDLFLCRISQVCWEMKLIIGRMESDVEGLRQNSRAGMWRHAVYSFPGHGNILVCS